jgi:hypothetical protein
VRGLDRGRRQAPQIGRGSPQWRSVFVAAARPVGQVAVPKPHHHVAGQKIALCEFKVGGRVEIGVGDRPHQRLEPDRRAALVLCHQADDRRHVATNAVADHRQPPAVDADIAAMLGNPFGGAVSLINRGRVLRLGRWGVIREYRREARFHDQIAHQPLMGRKIPEHPPAAVKEHENRKARGGCGGLHDVKPERRSVDVDRAFRYFDPREVDLNAVLSVDQHLSGVARRQLLDWRSAAGVQRIEKRLYPADDEIIDRARGHF